MAKNNIILEKSFEFALGIIDLYKILNRNSEYVLSKQLLKSGTSIGANVNEAIAASSRKDFLNKMAIASKEARETEYWLKLLEKSKMVNIDYTKHLEGILEINKILTSIVKSTKESL